MAAELGEALHRATHQAATDEAGAEQIGSGGRLQERVGGQLMVVALSHVVQASREGVALIAQFTAMNALERAAVVILQLQADLQPTSELASAAVIRRRRQVHVDSGAAEGHQRPGLGGPVDGSSQSPSLRIAGMQQTICGKADEDVLARALHDSSCHRREQSLCQGHPTTPDNPIQLLQSCFCGADPTSPKERGCRKPTKTVKDSTAVSTAEVAGPGFAC
jgi:hypothetical protein